MSEPAEIAHALVGLIQSAFGRDVPHVPQLIREIRQWRRRSECGAFGLAAISASRGRDEIEALSGESNSLALERARWAIIAIELGSLDAAARVLSGEPLSALPDDVRQAAAFCK
jgi:hypothetical protein